MNDMKHLQDIKKLNNIILRIIIFVISVLIFSCEDDTTEAESSTLEMLNSYSIDVDEPSDLAFSYEKNSLLTVSDEKAIIYEISFEGKIIRTYNVDANDLEGVTQSHKDAGFWLVDEKTSELIRLNKFGQEIKRSKINFPQNNNKSGLEGITLNPDNYHLYAVSEKNPGLLIELHIEGDVFGYTELNFADDYSAIFYEEIEDVFWILSDDSKTLNKCTKSGTLIKSYNTNIKNAEGVVVDKTNGLIYIVSDSENRLYTLLLQNL